MRSGYQPDTRSASSRRADFDLQRRIAELERTVALMLGDVSAHVSFSFNSATTEPIVGNQVRINNASQTAATRLWISHTTFDGLDVTMGLSRISAGNRIYIQDFDDATKYVRYTVVGTPVNDGTYHDVTVTYLSGPANVPFQKVQLQVINPNA